MTFSALFCPVLLSCLLQPARAEDQSRPPNVVLFLVDDMGWMDCGAYGSTYYETPHIDQLAARGMLFTDAYAANPLCSPTRASILTGKYPARLGLTSASGHRPPEPADAPRYPAKAPAHVKMIPPTSLHYLPLEETTLAQVLREAGYRTGHFGKWHLGLTREYWPPQRGYDVAFHGAPDPGPPAPHGYFSPYSFQDGTVTPGPEGEYIVDRVADEAIRFIKQNRDRPFLASVWQYGVHGPWGHKEEYTKTFVDKVDPRGAQNNPIMASMLKSVDESLGRIIATLEELDLTDNTIVWFTSDNGGNVHSNIKEDNRNENIQPGHPRYATLASYRKYAGFNPPTNNAPLRAGKGTLYEGGVRIPQIVAWPGRIPADTESSAVVCTIDIFPTLLELLQVPNTRGIDFDGVSIAAVLRDPEAHLPREAVFNFFPHGGPAKPPGVTVRKGRWKLIHWFDTSRNYPDEFELYDLEKDIGESQNLAAEHPDVVKELRQLIDEFLADTNALVPQPNPDYDPDAPRRERPRRRNAAAGRR